MYIASYVKYVLFLLELNEMCSNTNRFSKNTPIPNLMKILPVELSCSMRKEGQIDTQTDRQTDREQDERTAITKLTVIYLRNFVKAPKN